MAEITEENTTLSSPLSVKFKLAELTGLENSLTLGTFATVTGEEGKTSTFFLVSDGNTAFALDAKSYAHLTYSQTDAEGPTEGITMSRMVVRSLNFVDNPVSFSVTPEHKWKGVMERWRSTVENINQAESMLNPGQNTRAATRWVPNPQPGGASCRDSALDLIQRLTWMASVALDRAPGPSESLESEQAAAQTYFDVLQAIKPMWD